MTGFWGRLSALGVFLVAALTLGFVRLDRPKQPRLPRVGSIHRWFLSLEARRRGRRDGHLGIPAFDEKAAPPEIQKLKQQADGLLRRVAAKWADGSARLKGEYYAIVRELAVSKERIDDLNADLAALSSKCAARKHELDLQRAQEAKRPADEQWRLGRIFYIGALVLIFVGEFPLNAVAFRLFQEDLIATYTMTAGLAATLILCAHALGIFLRTKPSSSRSEALAWVLGSFPVLVIIAIGVIREVYINDIGRLTHTNGLASLGPVAGTAIFVVINLVIYLGAAVVSYLRHDPAGDLLEQAERRVRKTEQRIKGIRKKLERETRHLRWLQTKKELWKAAGEGALRRASYIALRHKDLYESLMQLYWSSNRLTAQKAYRRRLRQWNRSVRRAERRAQSPPAEPKAWKVPRSSSNAPEIRIPAVFDNTRREHLLAWDEDAEVEEATVLEMSSALSRRAADQP